MGDGFGNNYRFMGINRSLPRLYNEEVLAVICSHKKKQLYASCFFLLGVGTLISFVRTFWSSARKAPADCQVRLPVYH